MNKTRLLIAILVILFTLLLYVGGYWMNLGFQVLTLTAFGLSWHLMGGYSGLLSMGHTAFAGLASYTLAIMMMNGFPFWVGIIAGLGMALCLGMLIAALSGRFAISGVYFMLLSISMNEILRIVVENWSITGGNSGCFLPQLNQTTPEISYVLLGIFTVGITIFTKILLKTRLGFQAKAMASDPVAAESLGINTFSVRIKMTILSAILAGVIGILQFYYYQNLFPDQTFSLSKSLDILMVCMIGGLGALYSPWIGAIILVPLSEGIVYFTDLFGLQSSAIKPIINAVILIVIMMKIPAGLIPTYQRKSARV